MAQLHRPLRPSSPSSAPAASRRDDTWKVAANTAMDRYACGDGSAFSELYDVLAPRLHVFLFRQTHDADVADDLVQQTFLQMHRGRRHFTPGAEVFPWSFAIARRLVIDRARRAGREPVFAQLDAGDDRGEQASLTATPEEAAHHAELALRLDDELSRVPEIHRVAFELVKRDQLSMAEAAEVLGITVTAVKLRAYRCYEALRASLGGILDEGRDRLE